MVSLGALALLLGCGDSGDSSGDGTGTGTESSGTGTESSGTETESSGTETGETGEPEPVCGDGNVDPGEACDDGNEVDNDGCTSSCEIGPCGFEYVTRELVLGGGQFEPHTPFVIDGEDLVVAHQLGEGGAQTGLVRAAKADGVTFDSTALSFGPGQPQAQALAVGPDGELFLTRTDDIADLVEVHRLDFEGTIMWTATRPSQADIPDLALSPMGELVLVNTIDAGPMSNDVELVGLDPGDGSELWAHSFGGPPAANGFSTDEGAALALGPDGQAYVGYDQYLAWDTLAPVVVAFGPGGDPDPLWTTQVADMPGRALEIGDIALGADGTLGLTFQRWDGSQIFWVAALEAETGVLRWVVSRDELELPDKLSAVRGVAVGRDRVVATGTWVDYIDNLELRQAYVLGLELGTGGLACVSTLDDYEPGATTTTEAWLPFDLLAAEGGYYLSGYVNKFNIGNTDLLLARVR